MEKSTTTRQTLKFEQEKWKNHHENHKYFHKDYSDYFEIIYYLCESEKDGYDKFQIP